MVWIWFENSRPLGVGFGLINSKPIPFEFGFDQTNLKHKLTCKPIYCQNRENYIYLKDPNTKLAQKNLRPRPPLKKCGQNAKQISVFDLG